MSTTPSKEQIFELLGRCLYICQQVEVAIKVIVSKTNIEVPLGTSQKLIKEKINAWKSDAQTLGVKKNEFIQKVFSTPGEMNFYGIRISYSRDGDKEDWQDLLDRITEKRNELVHTFAINYDLQSETSCSNAYKYLMNCYDIFKNGFLTLDNEHQNINEMMLEIASISKNNSLSKLFFQTELCILYHKLKRKDGWVNLADIGKKLKEKKYLYNDIVTEANKTGLARYIESIDGFEVKKSDGSCQYRVRPELVEKNSEH